ncbi:MAG: hypothetical protein M0020_02445 [Actinomycetota bacterium]|nr:hypothetical protein [Actinomycetota bacterium]
MASDTTYAEPVDALVAEVSRRAGWIESPSEAAAHIESLGVTDDDARTFYGHSDVFALGLAVATRQRQEPRAVEAAWAEEHRRQVADYESNKPAPLIQAIPRFFLKGVAFGLPMAIMVFAILILLFSLWAYFYFSTARATAIGLGTALSYFLAGGFTQAIGRRGLMYLRQGMFLVCLKVSALFFVAGVVLSLVVAAILEAFFGAFPVISAFDRTIFVVYFLDLSLLWLGLATLYMLQREALFSIAIALGIAVVFFFHEVIGWNIVAAQQVGILLAALFAVVCSVLILLYLHRKNKNDQLPLSSKLPRMSILVSTVAPFFFFGFLYFLLVFLDRLLAWTGHMPFRETFVWFRADYEVGENWALLGLLPALGLIEYSLYRFSAHVKARQLEYKLHQTASFQAWFLRFYALQLVLYAVMGVVGGLLAYFGIRALLPSVPLIATLFSPISTFVFIFALIGYLLAFISLFNISVFFWVSRPRMAILAAAPAVLVDFIVGFVLSRVIAFQWAVVGFTAGSITFALISTVLVLRVFANLDYYYYSAM